MSARRPLLWLLAAGAAEVALAVVDLALGADEVILTTTFVLPVLALAIVARPREVAAIAALAFALAFLSGIWNDFFLSVDHLIRLVVVAAGGALAVFSARGRLAAQEDRERMAILAEVGRMTDAPSVDGALGRLGDATVPAVARQCWVDVADEDGTLRRAFTRGEQEGSERVVVPLRVRDRTIGEVGFAAPSYTDDDRRFFGVLAGRVALALGNLRLLSELSGTRKRLDRILGSLAEAVTVHDAAGNTIYANDAGRAILGLSGPEALPADPDSLAGKFIITHEDGSPVDVGEFPGRRLIEGETDPPPVLTRSVRRDTGREYWLLTKATLLQDENGAPLAVNVIEDVTEAKDAELRQRFLDQAGQVLASSLDYKQALQRVCELAVPSLADWAAVDLRAPDGLERVAVAHGDSDKLPPAGEHAARYPPDPDSEAGIPAVSDEHLRLIHALGLRAVIIVPMTAGRETYGAMTFVSAESERTFDDDDFAFAQDLARRAASAVQNGRLYADQVRVARTLQRSLLPDRLPDVPGWESGASYAAGDARADVGGDFYDVVATDRGHVVVLGDVTGKGVEAAALTALVRHSAQMAARFDARPGAILGMVNAALREQPKLAPVSVVCALIEDAQRPRVTIASAGHPLPLLKREGDPPREVGAHDVLLGVVDQQAFTESTVEVEVGDALLFYTDGVIDAPGDGERFGEARLRGVVGSAPPDPAALLESIERELAAFVVAEVGDDRAMLVLRHTGVPSRPPRGPEMAGSQA